MVGWIEMLTKFLSENLKGRDHSEDLNRWENNIKMDLRKKCELDTSHSGCGLVVGSCEYDNEHCSPIKGREFLDYLSDYLLSRRTQ
jgi:hypothetical protein